MTHQAFLGSAEEQFLKSMSQGNLADFVDKLQLAIQDGMTHRVFENLSHKEAILLRQRMTVISEVANCMLKLAVDSKNVLQDVERETKLLAGGAKFKETKVNDSGFDKQNDIAGTKRFRQWFLDHIASPFPTTPEKHQLVESTNAELEDGAAGAATYQSCQLWFINTRRRSQWTQFNRKFAGSQPDRMETLCELLRGASRQSIGLPSRIATLFVAWHVMSEDDAAILAKDCVDTWKQMISWIKQEPLDDAHTWLDEAIAEGKQQYNEVRRKAKDLRRRMKEATSASVQQQPDPSEPRTIRPKRKTLSEDDGSGAALPQAKARRVSEPDDELDSPRLPSTVASSSRGSRTSSASSASSFGSEPSLIDAGSSSYDSESMSTSAFANAGWHVAPLTDSPWMTQ